MRPLLGLAFAAGLATTALTGSAQAQWTPKTTGASEGSVILVRDGCGRYWHRNDWGRCVPDRRIRDRRPDYRHYRRYYRPPPPPVYYVPPRYYGPGPGFYYRGPGFSFGFGY